MLLERTLSKWLEERRHTLVYPALGTLALFLGSQIAIPVQPVPITLHTFILFLIGLTARDVRAGATSVLLWVGAGALGLPVFAGGQAGLLHLTGPTGGYILGFLPAVCVLIKMRTLTEVRWLANGIGGVLAILMVLGWGALWLSTLIGFSKAFYAGFLPFLSIECLKLAVACGLIAVHESSTPQE